MTETVVSPRATEVALPLSWRQAIPAEWRVSPLRVPTQLLTYGVVAVAPMAGFPALRVKMYDRAVTVAQVLATPDHGAEALADCVMHTLDPSGAPPALSRRLSPAMASARHWSRRCDRWNGFDTRQAHLPY